MKITIPAGGHITIDDTDPRAIKIKKGYGYSIDSNGELKIGTEKTNFDLDTFQNKLKNKTATLADIQEYLLTII